MKWSFFLLETTQWKISQVSTPLYVPKSMSGARSPFWFVPFGSLLVSSRYFRRSFVLLSIDYNLISENGTKQIQRSSVAFWQGLERCAFKRESPCCCRRSGLRRFQVHVYRLIAMSFMYSLNVAITTWYLSNIVIRIE